MGACWEFEGIYAQSRHIPGVRFAGLVHPGLIGTEPRYSEYLVFEGICVDEQGKQHYLDVSLAYKRAVLNCIKYLKQFGYTEYQIYLLLSCAPSEGRVSGIVDVPNAVATLAIPLAIFNQDVRPTGYGKGMPVVCTSCFGGGLKMLEGPKKSM